MWLLYLWAPLRKKFTSCITKKTIYKIFPNRVCPFLVFIDFNKLKDKVKEDVELVISQLACTTISYVPYDWRLVLDKEAFKRILYKALHIWNQKMYFYSHKMACSSDIQIFFITTKVFYILQPTWTYTTDDTHYLLSSRFRKCCLKEALPHPPKKWLLDDFITCIRTFEEI